jgi:hypothetical protein
MYDISKLGNDYRIESIAKDYQEKYPLNIGRTITELNIPQVAEKEDKEDKEDKDDKDSTFLGRKRSPDYLLEDKKLD